MQFPQQGWMKLYGIANEAIFFCLGIIRDKWLKELTQVVKFAEARTVCGSILYKCRGMRPESAFSYRNPHFVNKIRILQAEAACWKWNWHFAC